MTGFYLSLLSALCILSVTLLIKLFHPAINDMLFLCEFQNQSISYNTSLKNFKSVIITFYSLRLYPYLQAEVNLQSQNVLLT